MAVVDSPSRRGTRTPEHPPMIASIQRLVRTADCLIARTYLGLVGEGGGLLAFLFHSLFRDEREIARNHVDPLQHTTVDHFRAFVEYYLEYDYQFIGPDDLQGGLKPGGKYALVSFDDGYFNNALALPVLDEYRIPAAFFISTDHVCQNKCFWWDVLYRERIAQGATPAQIYSEGRRLKSLTTEAIEGTLVAAFGAKAFQPRGDIDRPFTPGELRALARMPSVHLGNHTANHAILTNYAPDEARSQIARAQESLAAMTGIRPWAIAYPNGSWSGQIERICGELGLKIGFTVRPSKNTLPIDFRSPRALRLGRFTPHHEIPITVQCRTYRSDILLYGLVRAGFLRLARGRAAAAV
jgi:peptidoglycan/xylan/chitin deacetylase (PgdA/CDA1 family)